MGVSAFFTVSDSAISHARTLLTLSGPTAKAHAGTIWGQGAFSRGHSTQRLFIFRKCQLTDRRCSKMPTAPGSCCLQTGALGAQVMTWINIRVGFSAAAKCLSTVQPSGSQTLTKILLLILQQVLNWRLRSEFLPGVCDSQSSSRKLRANFYLGSAPFDTSGNVQPRQRTQMKWKAVQGSTAAIK